jgi:hypothetical protein
VTVCGLDMNSDKMLTVKVTCNLWTYVVCLKSLQAPDQGSTVGGLLSVSLPEEHHERRTFCRRGSNPRMCDSGSAIDT